MTKTLVAAVLLSTLAVGAFAQASAPEAASAPAKKHHVKHAKKPVTPASNPMASPMKTGDGK